MIRKIEKTKVKTIQCGKHRVRQGAWVLEDAYEVETMEWDVDPMTDGRSPAMSVIFVETLIIGPGNVPIKDQGLLKPMDQQDGVLLEEGEEEVPPDPGNNKTMDSTILARRIGDRTIRNREAWEAPEVLEWQTQCFLLR